MAKSKDGLLTDKQKIFCLEYLIDGNGARAAREAGYSGSDETIRAIASENLTKPNVSRYIQEHQAKRLEKLEITGEKVLDRLDQIGLADVALCFEDDGRMKRIQDIPLKTRQAIQSLKTIEYFEGTGRDREQVGWIREIDFGNKVKANELLARHLGLLNNDKNVNLNIRTFEQIIAGGHRDIDVTPKIAGKQK